MTVLLTGSSSSGSVSGSWLGEMQDKQMEDGARVFYLGGHGYRLLPEETLGTPENAGTMQSLSLLAAHGIKKLSTRRCGTLCKQASSRCRGELKLVRLGVIA